MNITQVQYFLTAARTLNFTEAAKQLYISQPALSKQITAIENELNMMLFVRSKKKLRLTPAGAVLLKELPQFEAHYEEILHKARIANEGNEGELTIGILQGQMVGDTFTKAFAAFSRMYPNISIRLLRDSFSGLRRQLAEETIDIAISLDFDIGGIEGFHTADLEVCPAVAAISNRHPLAKEHITGWEQLKGCPIIAVEAEDCPASAGMILEDARKIGYRPSMVYASSLEMAMLWIEAGLGVGFINTMNNLTINPNIKLLKDLPCNNTTSVMAWKWENINPAIALFTNYMIGEFEKKEHL